MVDLTNKITVAISSNIKIIAIIIAILSWFYVSCCYAKEGHKEEYNVVTFAQLGNFKESRYPVIVTHIDEEFLFIVLKLVGIFKIRIDDLSQCEYLATKKMYDYGQGYMQHELQVNAAINNFKRTDMVEDLKDQITRLKCFFKYHTSSLIVKAGDSRLENLGGYWIDNKAEIFVLYTIGDYLYIGTKKGIFGINHRDKDPNAPLTNLGLDMPVYAITSFDNHLYVGTEKGVFRKDTFNIDSEWENIMETDAAIKSLLVHNNYLYAAGQEGVFRINLTEVDVGWEDLGLDKGMYVLYEYNGYLYASDGEKIFCMSLTDENSSYWSQVRNLYDIYNYGIIGVPSLAFIAGTMVTAGVIYSSVRYIYDYTPYWLNAISNNKCNQHKKLYTFQ